jgi:hypothetical protein
LQPSAASERTRGAPKGAPFCFPVSAQLIQFFMKTFM